MTIGTSSDLTQPGAIIAGKYRVDRVLGVGGMGIVVAATHEQLDQKVALKFLLPEVAAKEEYRQRFLREARAAVKIQSEHVARVLDVDVHQGSPYMVMEYLEGSDLSNVLTERGPLAVPETVGFVLEACEAIAEAHSLGIIHRDLKPANLFLASRPNGKPVIKVLDFGISKAPRTGADANLTTTSALMGSPLYMSPEQLVAASSVDVRSDVWALGVVLYEALTRKVPFLADTMPELVGAILQRAQVPLGSLRSDLPAAFVLVVDRCLEKEPAKRYANVAELARALLPFGPPRSEQSIERIEHVLGQPMAPAHSTPPADRALPAAGVTFSPASSAVVSSPGRRLGLAGALVMGGVVLIAAALIFLPRGSKTPREEASPSLASAVAAAASQPPPGTPSASSSSHAEALELAVPSAIPSSSPVTSAASRTAKPAASARPRPSAAPSASAPACHLVSYRDEDGNKHFRQECP